MNRRPLFAHALLKPFLLVALVLAVFRLGLTVAARAAAPLAPHEGSGFELLYGFGAPSDGATPEGGLVGIGSTVYGTTSRGGFYDAGIVYEITPSGAERILHTFTGGADGAEPYGKLLVAGGNLYGTTYNGGAYGEGTVYELTTAGVERVIYNFKGKTDGANPHGGVIYANGTFYGTTFEGGTQGLGTVFELSPAGKERVLYSFKGGKDGTGPQAGVVLSGGVLYGTTIKGGPSYDSAGTVFAVDAASGAEHVVYAFQGGGDGDTPVGELLVVHGELLGVTSSGGNAYFGTIFSVSTSGTKTTIYNFTGQFDGGSPQSGLTLIDGQLYGTTASGGEYSTGTLYMVTTGTFGNEFSLYNFGFIERGPQSLAAINGSLYGTTAAGWTYLNPWPCHCGYVYKFNIHSYAETILHYFGGGAHLDGQSPQAALTLYDGQLFGTTSAGGTYYEGTIFEIPGIGRERSLYEFHYGRFPGQTETSLVALNGTLYGTTYFGGAKDYGTIFAITPAGARRVIYNFTGGADGVYPNSGLIVVNGLLYGTTAAAGSHCLGAYVQSCGTVFSVTPSGSTLHTLYRLNGGSDGSNPTGGLTYVNGTLYGATNGNYGGTVLAVSLTGKERVLYAFQDGADGAFPTGGLVAFNGALYGTTEYGGDDSGDGTVYALSFSGTERIVHRFGLPAGGSNPEGVVVYNGALYGVTYGGGGGYNQKFGTIFRLTALGDATTLYTFTGGLAGATPVAPMIAGPGALYGTTMNGGYGYGTVFKFVP
jgi:uncharacterized repeat protein (TIGR03803 family)